MRLDVRPFILLFVVNVLACGAASGVEKQVVGYYPHWMREVYPHSEILYDNLTHISHAFVWPTEDGSLHVPDDYLYPQLIGTAHARGVKVLITVGGPGQSWGFSPMTADARRQSRFIEHLVDFCLKHGYDGVDLDWEFPQRGDRVNLVRFVVALSQALTAANPSLTLSITLPPTDWMDAYDVQALQGHLDWLSVMTYDYHGQWLPHAGHNAPLYPSSGDTDGSVDQSVRYWISRGALVTRLNIGLAFYGRLFAAGGLHAPSTNVETLNYTEAVAKKEEGWTYHWDSNARVPYLLDPGSTRFITYDDSVSVRFKVGYVYSNNLRGAIVWALGLDYTRGGRQPLLEMVGRYLATRTDDEADFP